MLGYHLFLIQCSIYINSLVRQMCQCWYTRTVADVPTQVLVSNECHLGKLFVVIIIISFTINAHFL